MRSILLVKPCPDDLDAAMTSGASAIVADLAAPAEWLEDRRRWVDEWLTRYRPTHNRPALYVKVHDLGSGLTDADLDAVVSAVPDGVLLPRCRSGADVQRLGVRLSVIEAEGHLPDGSLRVLAEVGFTAAGVLALPSLAAASPRLAGLVWDDAALAGDLGLPGPNSIGPECDLLAHGRSFMVLVAKAAGVPAFDTLSEGLDDPVAPVRRAGFSGALTRDRRQVPIIEARYSSR